MSDQMEPGPELDARLCELLEPKPPGAVPGWLFGNLVLSTSSSMCFWKWQTDWDYWRPIPVSTDLGATGKAIEILEDYDLDLKIDHPHDGETYVELQDWRLDSPVHPIYCGLGQDIPHAFSLALVEALEARAEEQS